MEVVKAPAFIIQTTPFITERISICTLENPYERFKENNILQIHKDQKKNIIKCQREGLQMGAIQRRDTPRLHLVLPTERKEK